MKFRFHRGGLGESMATMTTIDTREQLELIVGGPVTFSYVGYDDRIAWDTYYVSDKNGVVGMSDGKFDEGLDKVPAKE